jgi:hypothetical protein
MRTASAPQAAPAIWPTALQFGTHIEDLHRQGWHGQGVTVAVVDSGIDTSDPVLMTHVIGGINLSGEGPSDDLHDYVGHGATVTRIILTLAPEARIYVVKIFGNKGECDDAIAGHGLAHAVHHGDITNASIGSDVAHPEVLYAIRLHEAAGRPLIAAAGNSGDGSAVTVERIWPAADPYCTAVAAWDRSAFMDSAADYLPPRPAAYSSSYPEVDVTFLGRIPLLWEDGTSYGCPQASAAVAVHKSMCAARGRPWNDTYAYAFLTDHVRQLPGLPLRSDQTGYGLFDLRAAAPERLLEIDVDTLECYVEGAHRPELRTAAGLENRPPGGLYGWLRPILEAAAQRVGYDDRRRRAKFYL